ncbi:MAG: response regulator [Ignavibacteriaceae bacterium]
MEKKRIMIVEDEGIIALDIKKRLESLGYYVPTVVDSGEKAIEEVHKLRPDLIIMDIVLKGKINGVDTSILIWKFLAIPVIYITSCFDEDYQQLCKCSNLNYDLLLKPINQNELKDKVERALQH